MLFDSEDSFQPKLLTFCDFFCMHHGANNIHDSELLALEFRKFFRLPGDLRLADLGDFVNKIGIVEFRQGPLPNGQRGLYARLGDKFIIQSKIDDYEGSQEFTVAHELREIIGNMAHENNPDFEESQGDDLEMEADAFAAALLMESKAFKEDTISSGLDPILLQEKYHKSYIAIISRMASVLSHEDHSPFWGTVLEYNVNIIPGFFITGCFHRTKPYLPSVRYTTPNMVFPKRGQLVPIKGSLRKAVENGESIFIKRLSELDFWDRYCLSVLIRPVKWKEKVVKLVIIAIPDEHIYKIRTQLYRVSPIIVENVHQFLWEEA